MAHPQQVEALRQYQLGQWLKDHPGEVIDLSGEDLSGLHHSLPDSLVGANLSRCKLKGALFIESNLEGANLEGVELSGAHFSNCTMRRVRLAGAELSNVDFSACDLTDAILSDAVEGQQGVALDSIEGSNIWANGHHLRVERHRNTEFRACSFTDCTLIRARLRCAMFSGGRFLKVDMQQADLAGAALHHVDMTQCDMRASVCCRTSFDDSILRGVNLSDSDCHSASFILASLLPLQIHVQRNIRVEPGKGVTSAEHVELRVTPTSFANADLRSARLQHARLVEIDLRRTDLSGARVYGVSAWDAKLEGAKQIGLVAGPDDESWLLVDDIEIAQLVYLLVSSKQLRRVVDTLTRRAALLLGSFGGKGKQRLDALAAELRGAGYLPLVFDCEGPKSRNLMETVLVLSGLSAFVIADITEGQSVANELRGVGTSFPSLPIQMLTVGARAYSMSDDLRDLRQVLPPRLFGSLEEAVAALPTVVRGLVERAEVIVLDREARARERAAARSV